MKCPVCKMDLPESAKICSTCGFTKLHVEFVSTDDAVSWVEQVVIPYRKEWEKNRNNADDLFKTMKASQLSRIKNVSASKDIPFEFEIDEKGAVITRYTGSNEAIQIPSYYNNIPVYRIADGVFQNCLELKHIELPAHLQIIGKSAFAGSSIVGIDFNEELIEIGDKAFENTDLGEVIIPNSVKYIGKSAFRYSKFPSVSFDTIFSNKPKKKDCTTDITLGCGIMHIGEFAFSNTATTKLVFPEALTIIPANVCWLCSDLNTVIILGARKIGVSAFHGCGQLKNLILPEALETIDEYAFSGCTSLNSIVLPENVKDIASNSIFYDKFSVTKPSGSPKIAFLGNNVRIATIRKDDFIMKKYGVLESFDYQTVVFYCNPGSSAQKYARENSIRCYPLSEFIED